MSDGNQLPLGTFKAPRIPFDLRCVILAAFGYLVLLLVDRILGGLLDTTGCFAQVFGLMAVHLGSVAFIGEGFALAVNAVWGIAPCTLSWWQVLIAAVLFFSVWSLFGGALARTAALRLTRDAPISIRDALAFSATNFHRFLAAPVLVSLFAGFFFGCNVLAGAILAIPGIGSSILVLVLFPLVLLSSLMIILSVILGAVGVPLMWAGIATELTGPLDALSRTFSYIFARRFQFLFGYLMIFVLMSIVMLVGYYFEGTVEHSVQAGSWREGFDQMLELQDVETDPDAGTGIKGLVNIRNNAWWDWLGFAWMWFWLSLFLIGFHAYAIYVFLGGSVSLYLTLRHDVDGTREEEIEPPLDEDEELAEAYVPRWVGSGSEPEKAGEADDSGEKEAETEPE